MLIIHSTGYEDVVKKLIDNNADTDIKNNSGATARSFAESRGMEYEIPSLRSYIFCHFFFQATHQF